MNWSLRKGWIPAQAGMTVRARMMTVPARMMPDKLNRPMGNAGVARRRVAGIVNLYGCAEHDKRVSKNLGFGPNGAASTGSSQSVPTPHCSPAAPRNPCSTAAADPTNQKSAPPPSAAAAPQNHAARPGATLSPTGSPTAPVPTPTTPRHDTCHQPKSAPAEGTAPPVLQAPAGRHPDPGHPPDAPPPPAAIPRCPPQYDACGPSFLAGVVIARPPFSAVFTAWRSIIAALGSG